MSGAGCAQAAHAKPADGSCPASIFLNRHAVPLKRFIHRDEAAGYGRYDLRLAHGEPMAKARRRKIREGEALAKRADHPVRALVDIFFSVRMRIDACLYSAR